MEVIQSTFSRAAIYCIIIVSLLAFGTDLASHLVIQIVDFLNGITDNVLCLDFEPIDGL